MKYNYLIINKERTSVMGWVLALPAYKQQILKKYDKSTKIQPRVPQHVYLLSSNESLLKSSYIRLILDPCIVELEGGDRLLNMP